MSLRRRYRLREVEAILGVSSVTLWRWRKAGKLRTYTDHRGIVWVTGKALGEAPRRCAKPAVA